MFISDIAKCGPPPSSSRHATSNATYPQHEPDLLSPWQAHRPATRTTHRHNKRNSKRAAIVKMDVLRWLAAGLALVALSLAQSETRAHSNSTNSTQAVDGDGSVSSSEADMLAMVTPNTSIHPLLRRCQSTCMLTLFRPVERVSISIPLSMRLTLHCGRISHGATAKGSGRGAVFSGKRNWSAHRVQARDCSLNSLQTSQRRLPCHVRARKSGDTPQRPSLRQASIRSTVAQKHPQVLRAVTQRHHLPMGTRKSRQPLAW